MGTTLPPKMTGTWPEARLNSRMEGGLLGTALGMNIVIIVVSSTTPESFR
jgi:hypothetical protein